MCHLLLFGLNHGPICQSKPNIDAIITKDFELDQAYLKYGTSQLHAWIRVLHFFKTTDTETMLS